MTDSTTARSIGPVQFYRIDEPRGRRLRQILVGLPIFSLGLALSVEAALGVNPWTVFHDGVAQRTPLTIGTATIVTGLVLLVAFPLMRQPMGLGTLLNVAIVGTVVDLALWAIPDITAMPIRILALALSPVVVGLGSGLYIGAGLGPGPRDGIMTALERGGMPVWLARTLIELTALIVGWLLGGDVGLGTVWTAGSVGYFVQFFLQRLRIDRA